MKSYVERVQIFFKANHIGPSCLLSYVGRKTYIKPVDCSFDTLTQALEEHFEPKPNIIEIQVPQKEPAMRVLQSLQQSCESSLLIVSLAKPPGLTPLMQR